MKFNAKHFKFIVKSRRFKLPVWQKYYSLIKQKKLSDYDKFWVQQLRAQLKENQFKLIGIHLPTKIETEWTLKNDLSKKKIEKKEYLNKLLLKVKDARVKSKATIATPKIFEGASYSTVGGVFTTPGRILPIGQNTTTNNPLAMKKPRHKDKNYLGIELEFNDNGSLSQNHIANKLKEAGLAKYVDVGRDGSCGWEVRVLILENEFEPILTKIMNLLDGMGFETNESCGTHVHFDMRNRDHKNVYANLFKTQKFLRKFLTRNRKYNTYCKMNKCETFDKQMSIGDRYYSINAESFRRHSTIEVRMHQGTLKAKELVPWIHLLLKIINHKTALASTVTTLRQAKTQFEIDEILAQDLENKIMGVFSRAKTAAPNVISRTASAVAATIRPR